MTRMNDVMAMYVSGELNKHTTGVRTRLLHISPVKLEVLSFKPQLPAGYGEDIITIKHGAFHEPPIPRVSFSKTIAGCFRGVYANMAAFFEDDEYDDGVGKNPGLDSKRFYVYELTSRPRLVLTASKLIELRMVHDAHITGEHWVLEQCNLRLIDTVSISPDVTGRPLKYHPFNDKSISRISHSPLHIKYVYANIQEDIKLRRR